MADRLGGRGAARQGGRGAARQGGCCVGDTQAGCWQGGAAMGQDSRGEESCQDYRSYGRKPRRIQGAAEDTGRC
eukprot:scaffold31304_cov36-Tisochrysis_lutea.AAC.1